MTLMVVLTLAVLFLVISKDLDWLTHPDRRVDIEQAQRAILIEFLFVALVILSHLLNAALSYARNLRMFFQNQNSVLEAAAGGRLDARVPISSNDDFGVMAHYTNQMIASLGERTALLQRTQDVTILSLASLAETRDNETGAHILRTQRYVRALAMQLRNHPRFSADLGCEAIELIYKSAPLHDVGKVGVPDAILLKPGKLTDEEWAVMRTHPQLGALALQTAEDELGSNSFLRHARDIALTHHEKWDGSGYPRGLKGEQIPLPARIMSLVDMYDALISERIYKEGWSHDRAVNEIVLKKHSHFDPNVVEAFVLEQDHFQEIAQRHKDEASEFKAFLEIEIKRYGEAAKAANIQPQ
jgi:response regulator RpfG family c-di-GMP phosphodiesterase